MRLFIGIPLPAATADSLASIATQLRTKAASDNLRWSTRESWHITLQFLGSTRPEQYDCIVGCLSELHHAPVSIELGAVGAFERAGVLFVDVLVSTQLTSLQQAITAATASCGFTPEDRPYHPHITLARRKGKSGSRELRSLKLQTSPQPHIAAFTADCFLLYESTPTPQGSRYDVRERYPLDAA